MQAEPLISAAKPAPAERGVVVELRANVPGEMRVIRRNGKVHPFDASKITVAITKAFLAVEGGGAAASRRVHEVVDGLADQVVTALFRRLPSGGTIHIEDIQDQVELALMRGEHHKVARAYVLYRAERARLRAERQAREPQEVTAGIQVTLPDGRQQPLDMGRLKALVDEACHGLDAVDGAWIIEETRRNLFDGVPEKDVAPALLMAARTRIEQEPNYSYVTARLLLDSLRREALGFLGQGPTVATQDQMRERYPEYFADYIKRGAELELLSGELTRFDTAVLGAALKPERDLNFSYLGLQTLYDRYFIHSHGIRFELPQAFFMRVAMGLASHEIDREARAIEFYDLLSSFDFMSSTPTLFNSGTLRPQLSSCYLTTVPDDLDGIYGAIKDNALLSKYAGGLGNDWTRVRGLGAHIKGTNGKSQGVVPFLKVANDTAVAVNQCFDPETSVYTADGVKAIREVKVGDLVLGMSGTYREVTDVMLYNQTDPMVEIDVKHSVLPLVVTAGHPFWAIRGVPLEQAGSGTDHGMEKHKVQPEWVEAGALRRGDYLGQVIPKEILPVADFMEEDARLYGILLGDGHLSKNGKQWGVSGHPGKVARMSFVRTYLEQRGIHYRETSGGESHGQIHWSSGLGAARDGTTGRVVGAGASTLPLAYDDLYNAQGEKRISRRFSHLPPAQTLALLQGLLETEGRVSRGEEIHFTHTSRPLIEGVRYQLLRLGVPVSGQYRERENAHGGRRQEDTDIHSGGATGAYDLRIPAIPDIARLVGCRPITRRNWMTHQGCVFSRIRSVKPAAVKPFVFDLKVEGDESYMTGAALAHNGGKRLGAVCAYLETWHLDIEEFLELRKNTGDDRRRTHDMNTANWVPDLFMKRVAEEGDWTLFSPSDTHDLHDLTGAAFERRYLDYEARADRGEIALFKRIPALQLWRKMLSMLFETGHPWITFKDPCNLRYTNQHVGVVHSSNLCTEITLHTHDGEIAVCNLGSVNLAAHLTGAEEGEGGMRLDADKLGRTIATAMRMLDNVIDINYYSVPQARRSNLRHRPVGLGLMGFQDALYKLGIPYASEQAVAFADRSMELISHHAIRASTDLAEERGVYSSFQGSLWSQGILPIDSIARLEQERGGYLQQDRSATLDWDALRERVKTVGMRNSNTLAIAPTATISNICGVSQSIEPTYQNLFVKSNLSGEFTVVNPYLVAELKQHDLWDAVMINDLKYYDGSVQKIERVPEPIKQRYATAFEMDARWLIEAASRRQKWIDQAQSLNLYLAEPSGKKLDTLYKFAWVRGLKTTYYLRTLGATHVEKSTAFDGKLNAVKSETDPHADTAPKVCAIDDPTCEACQ